MPAKLIWREKHYVLEYSGIVTVDETVRVYGELVGSGNFDSARFGIVDLSKVDEIKYRKMDFSLHAAMSKSAARIRKRLRVGLVISTEEVEEAIKPFMQSVTEKFQHKWERQIFRNYEDAVAWASSGPPGYS